MEFLRDNLERMHCVRNLTGYFAARAIKIVASAVNITLTKKYAAFLKNQSLSNGW
jgi:hypothetical protein